eukprot:4730107-Prymnesium_polylepis.1
MWPLFRELALLLPATTLELTMVSAGSSAVDLPAPLVYQGSRGGSLTLRARGGAGEWYHHVLEMPRMAPAALPPADVAVALNAGLAVPNYNWPPTLRALQRAGTPFYFTDYSEYSAEKAAAVAVAHGMVPSGPIRLNPFRAPLRHGLVNGGSVGFPWVSNGFIAGFR